MEMHPIDKHFDSHKRFYFQRLKEKTHAELVNFWRDKLTLPIGMQLEDVQKVEDLTKMMESAIICEQNGINLDAF